MSGKPSKLESLPDELLDQCVGSSAYTDPGLSGLICRLRAHASVRLVSRRLRNLVEASDTTHVVTTPSRSFLRISYFYLNRVNQKSQATYAVKKASKLTSCCANAANKLIFPGVPGKTVLMNCWDVWAWDSLASACTKHDSNHFFPNLEKVVIAHCTPIMLSKDEETNNRRGRRLRHCPSVDDTYSYPQHLFKSSSKLPLKHICYHAHNEPQDDDREQEEGYTSVSIPLPGDLPSNLTVHCSLDDIPEWTVKTQSNPCAQTWYITIPPFMDTSDQQKALGLLVEMIWETMLPNEADDPIISTIYLDENSALDDVRLSYAPPPKNPETRIDLVTLQEASEVPSCKLCTDTFCTRA